MDQPWEQHLLFQAQNLLSVLVLQGAPYKTSNNAYMLKKPVFLILLTFITLTYSCKKTYETAGAEVVINELMPLNLSTVADNYGEFDDWIELFNKSSAAIDLSGFYLSDNHNKPSKWQFPAGTVIEGYGYLIIWTDGDSTQTGLHTNFKLSSVGEEAVLAKPDLTVIDKISFPVTNMELSFSRVPNGTGAFKWQNPTFNSSNDSK
jgi:hypothetical protein